MIVPDSSATRIGGSRYPERRGVSNRSVIEVAKSEVEVIALADLLCGPGQMRRVGKEWVGSCPLPDHEDKSPSFTVNPEKNLWFCHGCVRGGDVVTLAQRVWDIDRADDAAGYLLLEFGHEIPLRPPSWYAKNKRQAPVREQLKRNKMLRVQRRLYRWLYAPIIARFEDEDERLEEARTAWEECELLARLIIRQGGKAAA